MKILLVEDDERLGYIMVKLFKSNNYDVDWASDYEDCYEYVSLAENSYKVIILDYMLPEKDGLAICEELRNKYNFKGGIIFVTAKDSIKDVINGLNMGADDYIIKPFENSELIMRIEKLLQKMSVN